MSEEHVHLDESEVYHIRKQKLAELRTGGFNFPNTFRREHLADALLKQYSETEKQTLEQKHVKVSVAGRIVLRRIMGKASFFIFRMYQVGYKFIFVQMIFLTFMNSLNIGI